MMAYCMECGTKLKDRFLKNEGMVPFCEKCKEYRFPVFSTAVSMEVLSPDRDKVLLIKQYGKDRYILVAGYINKGENAEHTVAREVMEEIGLLNFSCVADSEDLSGMSEEEVDYCRWFSLEEAAEQIAEGSLAGKFLTHFLEEHHYSCGPDVR